MSTHTANRGHSRLLTMPLEILQQIASHLTTPDYGNLRCACKHLEASVFASFSREFFSKRQFVLTEFSLQALVDISNSRFSQCLTHVVFSVERPSTRSITPSFGPAYTPGPGYHTKRNHLRQEYYDHIALLGHGRDVEMIAEAFSNLVNLTTIEVRDFNSRSRNRDYPHNEWRSYGAKTYLQQTGSSLELPPAYPSSTAPHEHGAYHSHVFMSLLRASGKTASRPKRFEVNLRYGGLYDHAFHIPKYAERTIFPVLAQLKDLYLDLNPDLLPVMVLENQAPTPCASFLLRQFLCRVDQLDHLRLNFQSYRPEDARDFISWLSRSPPTAPADAGSPGLPFESPHSVSFRYLRQLDFGKVVVEPKILLAVFHKYRATLRGIDCHRVGLLDTTGSQGRVSLWVRFFGQLSRLGLNLNHITMSQLGQEKEARQQVRRITFGDCPSHLNKRTWEGQDLEGALKDFADNVVVDWPDTDSSALGSEDDEEDSMDDLLDVDTDSDDDADAVDDIGVNVSGIHVLV
ncbi:hypothetical protein BJ170DRAFT_601473 [Xylariales sp. AK1849]|nr:hypothetical protein BJ170DRAFT_601473 [Xylariales sp. AK1849]